MKTALDLLHEYQVGTIPGGERETEIRAIFASMPIDPVKQIQDLEAKLKTIADRDAQRGDLVQHAADIQAVLKAKRLRINELEHALEQKKRHCNELKGTLEKLAARPDVDFAKPELRLACRGCGRLGEPIHQFRSFKQVAIEQVAMSSCQRVSFSGWDDIAPSGRALCPACVAAKRQAG